MMSLERRTGLNKRMEKIQRDYDVMLQNMYQVIDKLQEQVVELTKERDALAAAIEIKRRIENDKDQKKYER